MRRFVSVLVFACMVPVTGAMAASADSLDEWLTQKGLKQQVQNGRAKVQAIASELALSALGLLGVPYKWGGNSPLTGLDCSGFVKAVYAEAGIHLPRVSADQAQAAKPIDTAALEPGDLVFFDTLSRSFSHVGIYLGGGRFIHSPREGAVIRIENMNVSYWHDRFNGARRVMAN